MDSLDEVNPAVSSLRRPADYYSTAGTPKPIFPRWVPLGCGITSIVVIVLMVFMAALISTGAFSGLSEMLFAQMEAEVVKMMAADVKPAQKQAYQAEMKTMRESLRSGKLSMDKLQPLMKSLRDVTIDEKVTGPEVERLTREVRAINTLPGTRPPK